MHCLIYDAVGLVRRQVRYGPREKEAIKTKHVVRPRPHQGHRDSFPSTVSTQSLSPLFSPPTHHPLRPPLTQPGFRPFPHRCNPSLSRSLFSIHHINLCTAGSNDKRTSPHPSSFLLRLLNPSRTHQLSLYNGYTRPHQRCKDKSCVFRILCAHTCPSPLPFPLSVRSRASGAHTFFWLRFLLTLNPSLLVSNLIPPFAGLRHC